MEQVGNGCFHGRKPLHKDGASCADALQLFGFLEKKNRSWSVSPGPSLHHKPAPFVVISSYAARKSAVPATRRWPRSSTAIRGRSASGAHASLPSVSRVWLISRGAVHRGLFPPEDRHKVVVLATTKPAELGLPISHWSLEDLAVQILKDAHYRDMSRSTINRILNSNDLKPHRCTQWLHSDDPDFERKALDIAHLYLDAPRLYQQRELVLCTDEKTSIQALERKHPGRPMTPGQPERREFEYIRHGTRCLIASLAVATGQIIGDLSPRRGSRDFCRHLRQTAAQFPEFQRFHWVMDNLNTHWNLSLCRCIAQLSGVEFDPKKLRTGAQRRAFLTDPGHKHVIHYTPKHGSWLNQIEIWFGVLEKRVIRRGNFVSKADLTRRILAYIAYYNENLAHPYRWTYTGQPLAA
jgi:DDE superfamily endonuclease